MRQHDPAELLQECLAAYDAGLSPEECLSAFPEQRAELEPLLRQALAARIAFARTPRPEFVQAARERLLFAAGREVSRALAAQPDPEFKQRAHDRLLFAAGREASEAFAAEPDPAYVRHARRRFLQAAGAPAQEALRAVPPPRLPFWANARRRFLEAAAMQRPRPSLQPLTIFMRAGLSTAAVALVLALAGMFYFGSLRDTPSVSAEYAALEQDWQEFELQRATGTISTTQLLDLTRRTNEFLKKLDSEPAAQPVVDLARVEDLVTRQKEVVNEVKSTQVTASGSAPAELRQAEQQVNQAELAVVRVKALSESTPVVAAAAPSASPTAEPPSPTPPPTNTAAPPTATPVPSRTPQATATSEPLEPGQVLIALAPDDDAYGIIWKRIQTADVRFVVPNDWTVLGVNVGRTGLAELQSNQLVMQDGNALIVTINVRTGESAAIIDGQALILRREGANAETVSNADLVARANAYVLELRHFVDSIELTRPAPTATPGATSTSTPTRTPSATPAASPTP